ncbi:MAG TPA: class I SAM-dependent methyltransferase [Solirubrobacteraceae bacterium]|nr:class I SAM-dependent methyltransferase [Solirubrobacteraceae bacterium]
MSDGAKARTLARERWNERYGAGGFEAFPDAPAAWLVEHRALLHELRAAHGELRALDVACGDGRNARLLAELGFAVDAVDVSDVAIGALRTAAADAGLAIDARVVDLERDALPEERYDVVVCMSYLQRDLFGALGRALRPGGLLLYETFARSHVEELGKAMDPAFVLDRNELLHAFGALYVRHYREGPAQRLGGMRGVASLVAQRLA